MAAQNPAQQNGAALRQAAQGFAQPGSEGGMAIKR